MNDFVKRLIKLYDDGALDGSDEAIFSHSGTLDSREFRKLARGSIVADAYKIVKIRKLKSDKPDKAIKHPVWLLVTLSFDTDRKPTCGTT